MCSDLYCSLNIIVEMGWNGHVACSGRERNAYRVLVGKPDRRRRLGRPSRRRDRSMKILLQEEIGRVWTGLIWFGIGTVGGLFVFISFHLFHILLIWCRCVICHINIQHNNKQSMNCFIV
jgi:hypothetical protein